MKCKKCKRIAGGGAVCLQGECQNCLEQVSSGSGYLPKFCKKCSKEICKCEMCGIYLEEKKG